MNNNAYESTDVPSAVIFVSFGASLVYSGNGPVMWCEGAFLLLIAYVFSIFAGLLFMKIAQLIETGDINDDNPITGPITVIIGDETLTKDKLYEGDAYYQESANKSAP